MKYYFVTIHFYLRDGQAKDCSEYFCSSAEYFDKITCEKEFNKLAHSDYAFVMHYKEVPEGEIILARKHGNRILGEEKLK